MILLHGGLGHGGNWGHQVPALVAAGYQAIVIDSRPSLGTTVAITLPLHAEIRVDAAA